MSAPGRSQALIPQRSARRVVQSAAGLFPRRIPERFGAKEVQ